MTVRQLVGLYESGAITGHELVVDSICLIDSDEASETLGILPPDTHAEFGEFVDTYRPGQMRSLHRGPIPEPDQVRVARRWLANQRDRTRRAGDLSDPLPQVYPGHCIAPSDPRSDLPMPLEVNDQGGSKTSSPEPAGSS